MSLWILLPLALIALIYGIWRGRRSGGHWQSWPADILALAALSLLCYSATASPVTESKTGGGPTLALVVDVSASMAATDAGEVSRLTRAKRELRTLASLLPEARFTLILFAGAASVQVPLGSDGEALLFFIDQLTPGQVVAPGSAPEEALLLAANMLNGATGEKAIVLFSDGERTLPERPPALPVGIAIHIVPCGTLAGASLPMHDDTPRRDARGEVIVTRLDGERLRRIASSSGGELLLPGAEPAVTPLLRRWDAPSRPDSSRWAGVGAAVALGLLLLRQLPSWPRRHLALVAFLLLAACQGDDRPAGELAFDQGVRLHQATELDNAATAFAEAACHLDGDARGVALFNQGTLLLELDRAVDALPVLEAALLLLPGDREVRTNFILALRAAGTERGGGFGAGERTTPGAGNGELSREQALQLLEGVKTAPGAPLSDKVQLRETPIARDW